MLDKLAEVPTRIAILKRKLAAREGKHEYRDNVKDLKAEIARLESSTIRAADAGWDDPATGIAE